MSKTFEDLLEDEDLSYYCEASGVIENLLIRKGLSAVPVKYVARILCKSELSVIQDIDGVHYIRKFNGLNIRKAIYGNIDYTKLLQIN